MSIHATSDYKRCCNLTIIAQSGNLFLATWSISKKVESLVISLFLSVWFGHLSTCRIIIYIVLTQKKMNHPLFIWMLPMVGDQIHHKARNFPDSIVPSWISFCTQLDWNVKQLKADCQSQNAINKLLKAYCTKIQVETREIFVNQQTNI